MRKKLPVPVPVPDPKDTGLITGSEVHRILRRRYRHVFVQDESYTFCDWQLVHSTLARGYSEWFPRFKDIWYDCDDYSWRAKGEVDMVIFTRVLNMLADIAMGIMHSNEETAKMAFFYSWVKQPGGAHMRCAGIDRTGLRQYEPQVIKRGPFPMGSDEQGHMTMG